jgi:Flp pilus assembly pilin Flp
MGGLWRAITDRFEAGDEDRVGIVEYALVMALSAVLATAGVLVYLSQLLRW